MTIIKRNRLIRRHADTLARRDGIEARRDHEADTTCPCPDSCRDRAYETAAHDTYHHLAGRRAYRNPTGRVHLAIGLPEIQRMLALAAVVIWLGACTVSDARTQTAQQSADSVVCGATICYPYYAVAHTGYIFYGVDPAADAACRTGCSGGGHCITDFDPGVGPEAQQEGATVAVDTAAEVCGWNNYLCQANYVNQIYGTCEGGSPQ